MGVGQTILCNIRYDFMCYILFKYDFMCNIWLIMILCATFDLICLKYWFTDSHIYCDFLNKLIYSNQ